MQQSPVWCVFSASLLAGGLDNIPYARAHTHAHTRVCGRAHTQHTHIHTRTNAYTHTHTHAYTHKHTHTHTHTHTQTHTHTHKKIRQVKRKPTEQRRGRALHFIIFWSGTELVNENKQTNEQWKICYVSVNRLIRGKIELKLIADYCAAVLFTYTGLFPGATTKRGNHKAIVPL